jgi:hypothetical protein
VEKKRIQIKWEQFRRNKKDTCRRGSLTSEIITSNREINISLIFQLLKSVTFPLLKSVTFPLLKSVTFPLLKSVTFPLLKSVTFSISVIFFIHSKHFTLQSKSFSSMAL